jgi:hypothetical protein
LWTPHISSGFGEGLGCVVVEHTKESLSGDNGNVVALVKVMDDHDAEAIVEKTKLGQGSSYTGMGLEM